MTTVSVIDKLLKLKARIDTMVAKRQQPWKTYRGPMDTDQAYIACMIHVISKQPLNEKDVPELEWYVTQMSEHLDHYTNQSGLHYTPMYKTTHSDRIERLMDSLESHARNMECAA